MLSPSCCSFYSFTGIIFMLFVYIMLATQPFFITGLEDIDLARKNAFGALMTFCTTFALSVFLIVKNGKSGPGGKAADDCWGGDHDGTHELGSAPNLSPKLMEGRGKQSYGAVTTDSY